MIFAGVGAADITLASMHNQIVWKTTRNPLFTRLHFYFGHASSQPHWRTMQSVSNEVKRKRMPLPAGVAVSSGWSLQPKLATITTCSECVNKKIIRRDIDFFRLTTDLPNARVVGALLSAYSFGSEFCSHIRFEQGVL